MSPGFYGKLPRAGDFVARRLPPAFVRTWDRVAARHLARRPAACWPDGGLRFHLADPAVTGVALPSADRAGRAFPLTLAAPAAGPAAPAWYDALAAVGAAAAAGELDADGLDASLAALPAPGQAATAAGPLTIWTRAAGPAPADPDATGPALDALFEAG